MSKTMAENHRTLLCVLFWLFESLVVAAVITLLSTPSHPRSPVHEVMGFAFWVGFLGLLILSLLLRRAARRLAVLGYITLFVGFWSLAFSPVL
jgi:hypothetical protein